MANTSGGIIVMGMAEDEGIATALSPVELSEAQELRARQIVGELTAPVVPFEILRIPSGAEAQRGYYVLVVEASPWRPHAVRINEGLRYPRREGPRIRYLSESEVADAYRNRFEAAKRQVERLAQVEMEGTRGLSIGRTIWIG